jgi:hypothetical protein
MDYVIRPLTKADEDILWEMLYQALQTSEGATSREIVRRPEYARYVEIGAARATPALSQMMPNKDEVLGAVWLRFPVADVKRGTPELAFAVKPGRKHGIRRCLAHTVG